MSVSNWCSVTFPAFSRNESFARVVVASFAAQLDPTLDEITDVKTAVSEAVTNSIIHGYGEGGGEITISCTLQKDTLEITVKDQGSGISDLNQAMEALYTSRPDLERSGMGFTVMENFMDSLRVDSVPGKGTVVIMTKKFTSKGQEGNG